MTTEDPDIVTLGSRVAYENRWMRVREDRIRRVDGSESIYGVVDKADFAIIAPIDQGLVHLVQQYRYPIGRRMWELPQGGFEGQPDADPLDVARGELEQETGLIAGQITEVGRLYPLYGAASHSYRIYLATQLSAGVRQPDREEQDMITRAFPLAEFEAMITGGVIQDAGTVASIGLLRMKGLF